MGCVGRCPIQRFIESKYRTGDLFPQESEAPGSHIYAIEPKRTPSLDGSSTTEMLCIDVQAFVGKEHTPASSAREMHSRDWP